MREINSLSEESLMMADISFDFDLNLTEEQKTIIEEVISVAKEDNGKIILTLTKDINLKGYVISDYRIDLINNFLDAKAKKSKIKRKQFNAIYSKENLIEKD